MPITLSWTPPSADSSPESPLETVSGLKEIRVYRSDVGYEARELVATLAASATIWQSNAYNNGRFSVVMVDNAGNMSTLAEVQYPASDVTPPPPVTNLEISASTAPPPPSSIARVDQVTVDLTGANYTIVDNDPAYPTVITYLTDDNSPAGTYVSVATLAAGVTSGRLNKTWVQGTHTFVCIKAAQNATETEQQCRPLSGLWTVSLALQNVTVSPLTIAGTGTATGTITLTGLAPSGGAVVNLVSSNPSIAIVPSTVTVPQGQSTATFTLTTANPITATSVAVTAALGSSTVTVTGISVTPFAGEVGGGGGGGSADWPMEPSGMTNISDFNFNTVTGGGWSHTGASQIVSDATAPISPPNVTRIRYPTGYNAGGSPEVLYINPPSNPVNEAFFGYAWKVNSNWQQEPNSQITKMIFMFCGSVGNPFLGIRGDSPYATEWQMELPTVDNSHIAGSWGDSGGGTRVLPQQSGVRMTAGTWYKIAAYMKKSLSPTSRDGVVRWWINGTQVGSYTDVNFPGGFIELQIAPVWGGMYSSKTQTDDMFFDHVYISVR